MKNQNTNEIDVENARLKLQRKQVEERKRIRQELKVTSPLVEKRYALWKEGARVFSSDSRHECLMYLNENDPELTFKEKMEFGWGFTDDGTVVYGTTDLEEAKIRGLRLRK